MDALFVLHGATSMARQLALSDFIAGRRWNVKIPEAVIAFGDKQEAKFGIQLLGSYASGNDSWLWAWGNVQSGLPTKILKDSETLRTRAAELKDDRFSTRSWIMGDFDDHKLAMICRGLLGADAYYRCPNTNGGALIVMIYGLPLQVTAPINPMRAVSVLSQMLGGYPVSHRELALAFFAQQQYSVEMTETSITATPTSSTSKLIIELDDHGRMRKLRTTLTGADVALRTEANTLLDKERLTRNRKPPAKVRARAIQEVASDSEEEAEKEARRQNLHGPSVKPGKAKGKLALIQRYAKK